MLKSSEEETKENILDVSAGIACNYKKKEGKITKFEDETGHI